MKNIHLIPTDKPSRLRIGDNGNVVLGLMQDSIVSRNDSYTNQNIYITSDEEINQQTKPCLCINTIKNTWNADLIYYQGSMPQYHYKGFKKIILTTDQDLINYGVQAIDDTFLEWFVKNPSCEEIRVLNKVDFFSKVNDKLIYKIIIPQEELKQETLEEAAEKQWGKLAIINDRAAVIAFKAGAKWQAERMYSEEEVYKLLLKHQSDYRSSVRNSYPLTWSFDIKEWFEQNKKKSVV